MEIFHEPSQNYVEVKNYTPESPEAFRAFYGGLIEKYPGCVLDFVYTEADAPEELLRETGAAVIDACAEMRLDLSEAEAADYPDDARIVPVAAGTFASFAALHDARNPGMYWTSERIRENLSRWMIYRKGDGYILLGTWDATAEVYALEAVDILDMAALLAKAVRYAFEAGKAGVLWMADEDNPGHIAIAEKLGFRRTGWYKCYRTKI